MEPEPLTAAERVAQLIEKLGISSYAFAKQTGISHQTISNVLNGISKPSFDTLAAIAKRYPKSANWLLLGNSAAFEKVASFEKPDFESVPGSEAAAIPSSGTAIPDEEKQEAAAELVETEEVADDLPALTVSYSVARMSPEQRALHYQVLYENERQERASERKHASRRETDLLNRLTRKPNASPGAADLFETVDNLAKEFPVTALHGELGFKQAGRQLQLAQ